MLSKEYEMRMKRLEEMTLKDAQTEISNKVYEVCLLYEAFEHLGKVRGNGHHMAQYVATYASDLMEKQWEK